MSQVGRPSAAARSLVTVVNDEDTKLQLTDYADSGQDVARRGSVPMGTEGSSRPSLSERVHDAGRQSLEVDIQPSWRLGRPYSSERCTANPAAAVRRTELGDGTTVDDHGDGLAGLGTTEHLADVVPELFLSDIAHADHGSGSATRVP